jgi:hypothetical protein
MELSDSMDDGHARAKLRRHDQLQVQQSLIGPSFEKNIPRGQPLQLFRLPAGGKGASGSCRLPDVAWATCPP